MPNREGYFKEWYAKNKPQVLLRAQTYRAANRADLSAKSRAYYKKNKAQCQVVNKAWVVAQRNYNCDKRSATRLCAWARIRARKKGLAFDLVWQDISIPSKCPVFGRPFEYGGRYAMSLDRIQPSLGYVRGNVRVVSKLANAMKYDATPTELVEFARWVLGDCNE